ncbi:hypothetical protein GCM10022197_11210 [Microlunatus spumicola]|uniref:Uncharacterized protein n=1 Tax=Microlunatus spumicola TaxID=81499 RepID=A0ABP6WYR6_9ACTN
MAVVHVYLVPGTLVRVQDGWCPTCQVSSVWTGPVWRLCPDGVSPNGDITGCAGCDTWNRRPAPAPDRAASLSRDARRAGPG